MNGPHDLGGQHGLGPIELEHDEPLFHAPWERRAFALTLAMGARGDWNIDMSRHAREDQHPVQYLSSSYYQIWLAGLERLMLERGLVTEEELKGGPKSPLPKDTKPAVPAERLSAMLTKGDSARVESDIAARFKVGDRVVAKKLNPKGHTRLPRYVRGREGMVEATQGTFVFADSNARGEGKNPQHLYAVRFEAQELWGPDAPAGDSVVLDLFESYLLPTGDAS